MQEYYENEYARYRFRGNIIHITYKEGIEIDLKASMQIVKDRILFQEEHAYPVLCDIRRLRKVDKPARDFFAMEGTLLVKALAFIIEPPVTDVMIQFYLRTNNPAIPTASFLHATKAVAFLGRFFGIVLGLGLF